MYGTISGVSALVPAAGALTSTSTPADAQVLEWLKQASARIDRTLASSGYSTPVASTATAYAELSALANLYGAAYVLIARGLDSANGEAENRSDVWLERFNEELKELSTSDLSSLGVTQITPTQPARRRLRTLQWRRVDGYAELGTGEVAE